MKTRTRILEDMEKAQLRREIKKLDRIIKKLKSKILGNKIEGK